MDFFQEPFYNKQPSYYLSLDMVILITFFFKKMMNKKTSKPWMFYVFYFFLLKNSSTYQNSPQKILIKMFIIYLKMNCEIAKVS
jgi:hypothetical protein